jgi:hypothetical protein
MHMGRCPTISLFLDSGAKPSALALRVFIQTCNFDGIPLRVRREAIDVVRKFVALGVDLNSSQQELKDETPRTPLAAAMSVRSLSVVMELVAILCSGGALVTQKNGVNMLDWCREHHILIPENFLTPYLTKCDASQRSVEIVDD